MTAPKISVLLPVFNGQSYLAEAMESVLHQTFDNFELVVIDDGSTDGSLAILKHYESMDERIRLVSRANIGLVETLNEGLGLCRGEFIARMDADDICEPTRFEEQIEFLTAHTDIVCAGTLAKLIDPEGRELTTLGLPLEHDAIDASHLRGVTMIVHPSVLMRRTAALAVGSFSSDYKHAEDIDFWLRMAESGRLANLDRQLIRYRQHDGSVGYRRHVEQKTAAWRAAKDASTRRSTVFEVSPPSKNLDSAIIRDTNRAWAWWALKSGNVTTARFYMRAAVRSDPFSVETWKLVYCCLRGR